MGEKNKGDNCSERVKRSFIVGRDLWRRVKAQAALEEKTTSDLVIEALEAKVNSKPAS